MGKCYHPRYAVRDGAGKPKLLKSKQLRPSGAFPVPCGQCIGCELEKSKQWATRLYHELDYHDKACFITLTYNEESLLKLGHTWLDHKGQVGGGQLHLKEWQNFAKKLRRDVGPFRFFQCGEYGGEKDRAHFHAILFGIDFKEDREFHGSSHHGDPLYTSETLENTWAKGYCPIGRVTWNSAAYVARYVTKRITGRDALMRYGGRRIPFATMSRKPGIGAQWFADYHRDTYRDDYVIINGKKFRPPRYYDQLLEKESNGKVLLEEIKKKRQEKLEQWEEEQTEERLAVQERVQISKYKILERRHQQDQERRTTRARSRSRSTSGTSGSQPAECSILPSPEGKERPRKKEENHVRRTDTLGKNQGNRHQARGTDQHNHRSTQTVTYSTCPKTRTKE